MNMLLQYKSIYVPQVDESDCGVACLAMILKKYHSRVSLAHLRHSECFTGIASGAISGAMGLSEFGIGGAVAGAVLSGGLAAWESCR